MILASNIHIFSKPSVPDAQGINAVAERPARYNSPLAVDSSDLNVAVSVHSHAPHGSLDMRDGAARFHGRNLVDRLRVVRATIMEATMRIRIMLTLLIYLIVQGVLFGIGMVIVMATPLNEQARIYVPWVVGLTFIIAVPVALGIAPRMKAWREMRSRSPSEEPRRL